MMEEIPREFIRVAARAFLLLTAVASVFALGVVVTGLALEARGFDWLTWGLLAGLLIGFLMVLLVVQGVRAALWSLESLFEHRREIERAEADALLREKFPMAAPVPTAPSLTVTTGVKVDLIGDLIDRRDLVWFCEQVAATRDWTARKWEGVTLPYGYRVTNKNGGGKENAPTSYARLLGLFTTTEIITQRGEGSTGQLAVENVSEMLRRMTGRPDRDLT